MPTPLANDLIDEALRCPCDLTPGPLCARCKYLMALAQTIDLWQWRQMEPRLRAQVLAQACAPQHPPLSRMQRVGYSLLGLSLSVGTALYALWHCAKAFVACSWTRWRRRPRPEPMAPGEWWVNLLVAIGGMLLAFTLYLMHLLQQP